MAGLDPAIAVFAGNVALRCDFPRLGQISDLPVQPSLQKDFCFLLTQIIGLISVIPCPPRGAFRDRHERWRGMRWTRMRY
jgi:hypothetical protein